MPLCILSLDVNFLSKCTLVTAYYAPICNILLRIFLILEHTYLLICLPDDIKSKRLWHFTQSIFGSVK